MPRWLAALRARASSIDLRLLGVFRIYFGCVVLFELGRRFAHRAELYTDAGLLSVAYLARHPQAPPQWSLFSLCHTEAQANLAFAGCFAVALAYTLGAGTKLVKWLVLACLVSLDARNLFLENGATVVMRWTALWTLLLPLGERYSIDAWLRGRPSDGTHVRSLAVHGIALQAAVIYACSGLHKLTPSWLSGEAIHYVLWQNRTATAFAAWLRMREPTWLSPLGSALTVGIELAVAVLLLLPARLRTARRAAVVLAVALHLAITTMMHLGAFSFAMIALVLLTWPETASAAPAQPRRELPPDPLTPWREASALFFIAAMIGLLFADDPTLRRIGGRPPRALTHAAAVLRLRQGWNMYAVVPTQDGMLVVDAVTRSGAHVDPFTGAAPDFEAPLRAPVVHSELMTHCLVGLATPVGRKYLPEIQRHLLASMPTSNPVQAFDMWWVSHEAPPRGSTTPCCAERRMLLRYPAGPLVDSSGAR